MKGRQRIAVLFVSTLTLVTGMTFSRPQEAEAAISLWFNSGRLPVVVDDSSQDPQTLQPGSRTVLNADGRRVYVEGHHCVRIRFDLLDSTTPCDQGGQGHWESVGWHARVDLYQYYWNYTRGPSKSRAGFKVTA